MIYISQLIDWSLKNNEELIIDLKNVSCTYKNNEYLLFKEDGVTNEIDLNNRLYKRIASNYNMEIDFNICVCKFAFQTGETCEFDITGSMEILNKKIRIRYSYETEVKEINITLKDDEI